MIFNGLEIKKSYKCLNGAYQYVFEGKLDVQTERGDGLKIVITPELCAKSIELCADHILDVATETVEAMKAKIIEGLPAKNLLISEAKSGN